MLGLNALSVRRARFRLWRVGGRLDVPRLEGWWQDGRRLAVLSFVGEPPRLIPRSLGTEAVADTLHFGLAWFGQARSWLKDICRQIIGRRWRRRWPFGHPTRKFDYDRGEGEARTNRRLRRALFDRRRNVWIAADN